MSARAPFVLDWERRMTLWPFTPMPREVQKQRKRTKQCAMFGDSVGMVGKTQKVILECQVRNPPVCRHVSLTSLINPRRRPNPFD